MSQIHFIIATWILSSQISKTDKHFFRNTNQVCFDQKYLTKKKKSFPNEFHNCHIPKNCHFFFQKFPPLTDQSHFKQTPKFSKRSENHFRLEIIEKLSKNSINLVFCSNFSTRSSKYWPFYAK